MNVRLAHTVHRDAANGGKGTALEIHLVGKRHTQVRRHVVNLGVNGVIGASAGDPVSWNDVAHPRARCQYNASGGVAERRRLVQSGADGADGLANPITPRLLHDLPDLIRPRPRLANQALLAGLDLASLSPGA